MGGKKKRENPFLCISADYTHISVQKRIFCFLLLMSQYNTKWIGSHFSALEKTKNLGSVFYLKELFGIN
jgi:hypothetical protein